MVNIDMSNVYKGLSLLVCGILLFCYSTGLISRVVDILVIALSVGMIFYGFVLLGGYKLLQRLLGKTPKQK